MGAGVIVLAGGSGSRMGGSDRSAAPDSKVFAMVEGRPLLSFSLEVCALAPSVTACVVVAREGDTARVRAIAASVPGLEVVVVTGGATRFASEVAGLEALRDTALGGDIDTIAIHDAARPFATIQLFEEVIAAARRFGGAVPGVVFVEPVIDTSGSAPLQRPGVEVAKMQTPQAFQCRYLYEAYTASIPDQGAADTAETVERLGDVPIAVVAGDLRNLKVTFPRDLDRAATLALLWRDGSWTAG